MPSSFLLYWKPKTVEAELASDGVFNHTGSEQLGRVRIGDTIWGVTVRNGEFCMFGRLKAGLCTDSVEEVRQLLGYEPWEANWHVLAEEGTAEDYRLVSLTDVAEKLRFVSRDRDRLTLDSTLPQQLQTMRILTDDSSSLLDELWYGGEQDDNWPLSDDEMAGDAVDFRFPEGRLVLRKHLARERSRPLVNMAKRLFLEKHGRLFCEACDFDFNHHYGERGAGFIEAHHTLAVSEMTDEQETSVDDLTLVCSNCHRMIHRYSPWLRIDELKRLIQTACKNL